MADPNRNILLVSHNFPPTLGPESVLVQLNTRCLHDFGWNVTALTTTMMHGRQQVDTGLLKDLPPGMNILRTPSWDAYLTNVMPRVGRILNYYLEQRWFPEPFFLWRGSARRGGLRWLRRSGSAILYSRAQKFVSNVVGLDLKRATGLPWIAHFSDPWVELIKRQNHPRPINMVHNLERAIIEESDVVVFVTQQTVDVVMKRYPDHLREKVMVIPHGYDKAIALSSTAPSAGPLQAIHAGAFYHGFREPHVLFRAIAKLNDEQSLVGRFSLVCVGPDTSVYQSFIEELKIQQIVTLRESVAFDACQAMIAASHLLVVVDTPGHSGMFLPTKVIEYFAHEKPVLALADHGSAVEDAMRRCGQPVAESSAIDECAAHLRDLLQRWESGTWGITDAARDAMRSYEIHAVNQPLLAKFEELRARLPKS